MRRPLALVLTLFACADLDPLYTAEEYDAGATDAAAVRPDARVGHRDAFIPADAGESGLDAQPAPDAAMLPIPVNGDYDLHAELFWDPLVPDDTTDVDLHLLHPTAAHWFDTVLDCYYFNQVPLWNGSYDFSPRLDNDIVNGHGPENITIHRVPEAEFGQAYRVGVHYFSAHGTGATDSVYVQVSCHGQLFQFGPTNLQDDDVWRVADMTFTASSCVIAPLGLITHYNEPGYNAR